MKRAISICISIIPVNLLRIYLYRTLLGYKINYSSKISMFNFIFCKNFVGKNIKIGILNRINVDLFYLEEGVEIRNLNSFNFLHKVVLRKNTAILSRNTFIGARDYYSPYQDSFQIEIGNNSIITNSHYFECSSKIFIGDNVVFGGKYSEVWTHGFDTKHTIIVGEVIIGNNIYIGSGSKIIQGVSICDDVSIGAGTIISKSIIKSGFYVSSQLIRKSDNPNYTEHPNLINYEGAKFVRK